MGKILSFFAASTLREWVYGIAVVAAVSAFWWYTEHERGIGEQDCQDDQTQALARAQASIDKQAAAENAKLKAQYDASIYQPINYKPAVDCGSVPPDLLLRINAAGKAGKH
jgi:hypothetical protein